MPLNFLRVSTSLRRGVTASGIIAAFLFAIALSDSPRLHEHFHKSLGDHQCAVTVFSSGACDHLISAGSTPMPDSLSWAAVFFPSLLPVRAPALEFSRLEHAPPFFA